MNDLLSEYVGFFLKIFMNIRTSRLLSCVKLYFLHPLFSDNSLIVIYLFALRSFEMELIRYSLCIFVLHLG